MTTLEIPEGLVTERQRRLENQRLYAEAFTDCPACPSDDGWCSLCLATRKITKGTQRFMLFGHERGAA